MLVESVDDIIAELAPKLKSALSNPPSKRAEALQDLTLFERRLLDAMHDEPIHIEALADRAGFPAAEALAHLLSLECKGMVRQMPGKLFLKV